ncbi:hypothetical protein PITC_044410 [Penicillium italicum]|uniref:Uncharacterized protein n=1 Tax=Penicillium italicum TaxID=40296 RepID=A0A0A2KUT0_PENIT|nr:hypothetical protein PITC_044410 [Penicillium italicum]
MSDCDSVTSPTPRGRFGPRCARIPLLCHSKSKTGFDPWTPGRKQELSGGTVWVVAQG